MSGSIGNTTFHQLNVDMLRGDQKIGSTAVQTDNQNKAIANQSLASKIFLGIITMGIHTIVQAVTSSGYENDIAELSKGTETLYKSLDQLTSRDNARQECTMEVKMFGEKFKLRKNMQDEFWAEFPDGKKQKIDDPKKIMKNIELDVMAHSELFQKRFVVNTVLQKYEDLIQKEPEPADLLNDVNDLDKEAREVDDFMGLMKVAVKSQEIVPALVAAKQRYDELLGTLFESRLGMSKEEVKFIDRNIGKLLAAGVMDGTVPDADNARSFVNRNASATHFTTIESSRIYANFEKARAEEERARDMLERPGYDNNDKVKLSSVQFKDGYYQPKPNDALPKADLKEVHDFVARIISDDNVSRHDADLLKGASADALEQGRLTTGGSRLRELFFSNRELIAKIMANREECQKDPAARSLLADIDPRIRQALETELDKLNARYSGELGKAREKVDDLSQSLERAEKNGENEGLIADIRKRLGDAKDALARLDDPVKGRAFFLRELLSQQNRDELKLRGVLHTADAADVHENELDAIGETDRFKRDEEAMAFKKSDGDQFLGAKKEKITLGANFFGDMEKRLNTAISEACQGIQEDVTKMVNEMFPDPVKRSLDADSLKNSNLERIVGTAAEDSQLQMIKVAMTKYFAQMPVMDQRSMLAAQVRFSRHADDVSKGARLGALLKGAGPVMQKMLQGLDPLLFKEHPDFQVALDDMKNKLAPISQDVIHAHLFDIVQKSNGAIKSISVDKALGAASVAQALKCTITLASGAVQHCVIKVLRPDAQMRAQREEKIFAEAAREVGNGMPVTFEGQFRGIMEEMDLTREAANVRRGNQVYDFHRKSYNDAKINGSYGSFSNVESMKLVDGIPPSKNVMALELVQGVTMEDYLKNIGAESRRIVSDAGAKMANKSVEAAASTALEGARELDRLYQDAKAKHQALVNLSYMWANEGLFAEGFYHGDIHKGNIMTSEGWKKGSEDAPKNITLIDFGNASDLNKTDRASVVKVVAGCATGDFKLFAEGYQNLLSKDGQAKFKADAADIESEIGEVMQKGKLADTGLRMSAILKVLQEKHSIEVPPAIHNFLESQRRLQTAMDEALSTMKAIASERQKLIQPYLENLDPDAREEIQGKLSEAAAYRPGSIMKSITDVVSQNLLSAMMSIGSASKAKQCYNKIKDQIEVPQPNVQELNNTAMQPLPV